MFLMIALVVLALLLVGYFYATARVSITAYKAEGMAASENAALFAQTQEALAQGTFEGTVFNDAALGPMENYAWITYTLRLSNQCLVPVDMVEVQVVPDPQDVLQVGNAQVQSLDAKTIGDVKATILTAKDSHSIRELIVTYYVWGVSFSIRETYGG
ncbi:MAG: hypothetical protein VB104_08205 [Candidatus Limiplasma sp.]|nr:hypothetical protein [Candidatus Limiplasma sp.]